MIFIPSIFAGKEKRRSWDNSYRGCEEKRWVVFKSERNLNMSMAEGIEPRGGEGKGQVETIPWSLDWMEREEAGSGPQVGGCANQEEEP